MMKHRYVYVVALVLAAVAGFACDKPNENARVQIEYDQIANFHTYRLAPDSSSSTGAGDGMFIMYKIKKITNTGSQAANYVFDKHKVVAVTPDKTSNEEPSGDNILLGSQLATNVTVAPGQTKTNPGCIIKHVLTPNPQSIQAALVDVIHQINTSQPVSMNRAAGDNTTAQVGNALPSALQNLCGS